MKRFFCVLLAVALIMGLSVQSFANSALIDGFSDVLLDNEDGITMFGTLVTSALTEERKDYMRDFFSVFCKNKDAGNYHYYIFSGGSGKALFFARVANDPIAFYKITKAPNSSVVGNIKMILPFKSTVFTSDNYNEVDVLCFDYEADTCQYTYEAHHDETGKWNSLNTFSTTNKAFYDNAYLNPPSFLYSSYILLWSSDNELNSNLDLSLYNSSYSDSVYLSLATTDEIEQYYCSYPVGLGFVDDDGLIESVTPDPEPDEDENEGGTTGGDSSEGPAESGGSSGGGESEEPPSSGTEDNESIETPKDTTISLPSIDYDSALIPYDLDLWNLAPAAFFPQLKKIVIVGMPIIIACIAIELLIKLIRHFAFSWFNKGGGSGGGGISVD